MTPGKSSSRFARFANATAHATGQPGTFATAVFVIVGWAVSGPIFHWSDTWQLVVNTGTTIVTFLMVFLIQSTQNRDSAAVQIKLDELLRISPGAHNVLIALEELDEAEIRRIRAVYAHLAAQARKGESHGRNESGVPPIGELVGKMGSAPNS